MWILFWAEIFIFFERERLLDLLFLFQQNKIFLKASRFYFTKESCFFMKLESRPFVNQFFNEVVLFCSTEFKIFLSNSIFFFLLFVNSWTILDSFFLLNSSNFLDLCENFSLKNFLPSILFYLMFFSLSIEKTFFFLSNKECFLYLKVFRSNLIPFDVLCLVRLLRLKSLNLKSFFWVKFDFY